MSVPDSLPSPMLGPTAASGRALLDRCTFPPPATAAGLRGLGRRRLARPAGPGRGRRLPGDRRPCRPRPAAGIGGGGRRGGRRRRPVRRRLPVGAGRCSATAPTSRPGPGRPGGGARPRCGHRPHRRRPGRDGAGQPAPRRRRARSGRHAGRPGHPLLALRRSETVALCEQLGLARSTTRPTTTPGSCATASATSCCRSARRSPGATSCPSWPARPTLLAGDADLLDAVARLVDPADAPPWPRRPWRWAAGPCAAG